VKRTPLRRRSKKRAAAGPWIAWVRDYVFRTRSGCQLCHGGAGVNAPHEMHEVVSRAQTRGRPAHERFNPWNCARLCGKCHGDVTARRVDILLVDVDDGCEGSLLRQPRLPGTHGRLVPRYDVPAHAAVEAVALWRLDHPGRGGPHA